MSLRAYFAATLALAAACAAQAQSPNPFAPPTDAMDTLSSGSASGGIDSGSVFDRVRTGLNQPGPGDSQAPPASPFGGPPPGGGPAASPFGAPPPAPGGDLFGEDTSFSGPVSVGGGNLRAKSGIGGTRVRSAISGVILQDARSVQLIITDGYFDDGASGGDTVANDGVFTNVTEFNRTSEVRYIAPEEFYIRTRLLNALGSLENFSPQDFFQVRVATQDHVSSLPKLIDVQMVRTGDKPYLIAGLETERDARLYDWSDRFLRDFREDPADRTSKFIPTHLPVPPKAPSLPLPATFSPRANAQAAGSDGAGADGGEGGPVSVTDANSLGDLLRGRSVDDPVTGQPLGAASSRYF
ncbi:MAG: hypothetical protein SF028_10895 [Candidatus Sumerlaeia bacterium]|nr:hypothetical protein [Candidatus Sumerlaeia bacterium]